MERKFINLRELKVKDVGPGEISGYRAVHSIVDEGGDVLLPGAFKECLAEYLSSGFTAHSHVWSFSEAIGFPVDAKEDSHGLFVTSRFHSTSDAQDIRTKAKERMAAGKSVGFSFGYSADEYEHVQRSNYKTELPRVIRASSLAENMRRAERFAQIRLLKKVSIIEDSLVTAPMNKEAIATAAKAGRYSQSFVTSSIASMRAESILHWARALKALDGPDALLEQHKLKRMVMDFERRYGSGADMRGRGEVISLRAKLTLLGLGKIARG